MKNIVESFLKQKIKTGIVRPAMLSLFLFVLIAMVQFTGAEGETALKKVNILVNPFRNTGPSQFSWISGGMTESVISDLMKISSISVFTEEDRKKAIREIELGMTGLIKESDIVKVGTIMGAQLIFSGNYTVNGKQVRINAKLVSIEKGSVDKAITIDGDIDRIFDLQDRIVNELMNAAEKAHVSGTKQAVVTEQDRARIKRLPRPSALAFELYSKGLELYDKNPEGALSYFNRAIASDSNYYHAHIAAGGVYSLSGSLDKANESYAKAWSVLKKAGLEKSVEAASLYYNIGINLWNRGDNNSTIKYSEEAYRILESAGEESSRLAAAVLMLRGGAYRNVNGLDDAFEFTKRSAAIYESLGLQKSGDYAWALNNLGVIYSMKGDHKVTIDLYIRSLEVWRGIGLHSSMGVAYTYCQLGYEYYIMKDYTEALACLIEGKSMCEGLKLNSSYNYAYYMWYIAFVYSEGFKDPCEGLNYLKLTVDIFEKQKSQTLPEAKKALAEMEKSCKKQKVRREKNHECVGYAEVGNIDEVQKCIKNKMDINARVTPNGLSALFLASGKGHLDVIKMFLSKGADINLTTYSGKTSLMQAAAKGKYDVVKYLVEKGADINAKDASGETALMNAVMWGGDIEVVRFLISRGADVNAKSNDGRSVLDRAFPEDYKRLLENSGAK